MLKEVEHGGGARPLGDQELAGLDRIVRREQPRHSQERPGVARYHAQGIELIGHVGEAGTLLDDHGVRAFRRAGAGPERPIAAEGTAGVDLVPHVAKERKVKAVLNNSFGFGGTNASLVMRSV